MARTLILSLLLLVAVVLHASQAKDETSEKRDIKANGYYPSDSLNLILLNNTKKYAFVDQNCTWFEASYFCNAYGMDLVTIESQNENDLIMEQVSILGLNQVHGMWTALHKVGRSTWLWMNGDAVDFSDWGVGEPDDPTTDFCMVLYQNDWHDTACNIGDNGVHKRGFVCEERLVIVP